MGLVSITNIADGSTIDGADVNSNMNALAATINGDIDNVNIVDGAINAQKLADGAVSSLKLATGAITESKLATGAVTTAKFKPTYWRYDYNPGGTHDTTSASFVDTGFAATYTSGDTPEILLVWVNAMHIQQTAGASHLAIAISAGTLLSASNEFGYNNSLSVWARDTGMFPISLPANTAMTLKIQHRAEAGGTSVFHLMTPYNPSLLGLALNNS